MQQRLRLWYDLIMNLKPFWVSWYNAGAFEYAGPWWVSGERYVKDSYGGDDVEQSIISAAVMAESAEVAMRRIAEAHDDPSVEIEWRFVERRPADWIPFRDRFAQREFQWPWPKEDAR